MNHILLKPSLRPQDGGGHFQRMLHVHRSLSNSYLYVPSAERPRFRELSASDPVERLTEEIGTPSLIVLDAPVHDPDSMRALLGVAPVMAVDLGGSSREMASYLVDTLPYPGNHLHQRYFDPEKKAAAAENQSTKSLTRILGLEGRMSSSWQRPNVYHPGLLPRPARVKEPDSRLERVLVSFGASDPAGLSSAFIAALADSEILPNAQGDVVLPPGFDGERKALPSGWSYREYRPGLRDSFADYDLFIGAYGLSAWEAQYAGVKTLVIDASFYHGELARLSGFLSLPPESMVYALGPQALEDMVTRLVAQTERVRAIPEASLSDLIKKITPQGKHACPCCGESDSIRLICRNEERSYFRCGVCRTAFQLRVFSDDISYDKKYFFEQYKSQYGRSYLDDFDYIFNMGRRRMDKITEHLDLPSENYTPRLLDIGCAFGPFLAAAAERGFKAEGIDISPDAVSHVVNMLGHEAFAGDIADAAFRSGYGKGAYDVVTMWYVIEHFPELTAILSWIHRILKPGGVFAIATPNSMGISGRRNLTGFLFDGPADHYTIWHPDQALRVGNLHGFMLREWESTGHHGERFPGLLGTRLRGFSQWLSRRLSLGDSFEALYIRLPGDE